MAAPWWARLVSATPEIVAAATFVTALVSPAALSTEVLRSLVLTMLVEFLVVHSSGLLSAFITKEERRSRQVLAVLGLGALYLSFAGAFALAFESWMPIWVVGWLLGSRVLTLLVDRRSSADEAMRQQALWAGGAALYIILALATSALPVPAFGLDEATRARMALPGSGLWIDEPQRPMVMGALYFGLLALFELAPWEGRARKEPEAGDSHRVTATE